MKIIARIYNNFTEKFGIPRQSGLVGDSLSRIVFEPEYRNPDALRGLEDFSHIWLIWEFSNAKRRGKKRTSDEETMTGENRTAGTNGEGEDATFEWSPTVRPPRLGGNERMGVFATRSPFRPNPIGLSCVEIKDIDLNTDNGPVITVCGADLMNGTPIYDIKPYIPYADSHPEALAGFTGTHEFPKTEVRILPEVAEALTDQEKAELTGILEQDPRPAYKRKEESVYRFNFANREIEFKADGGILTVTKCRAVDDPV